MSLKFLIVGDLHGQKPRIHFKGFDAIIAPGDFFNTNEARKYEFGLIKKQELSKEWFELTGKKKARIIIKKSIDSGRNILKYLNSLGVPVYTVPGNSDYTGYRSKWGYLRKNRFKEIIKGLKNIRNTERKITNLNGYQIIGYGRTNGPEIYKYRGYKKVPKKEEIVMDKRNYHKPLKRYNKLFKRSTKPIIFLTHNVPFHTPIDKIENRKSPMHGKHYGSLIVRQMIEKYKPLVSIGGHIHEHFGKCHIGKTVCVNAGFGKNVNTWLELERGKIKKLKFWRKGKSKR